MANMGGRHELLAYIIPLFFFFQSGAVKIQGGGEWGGSKCLTPAPNEILLYHIFFLGRPLHTICSTLYSEVHLVALNCAGRLVHCCTLVLLLTTASS